MFVDDLVEKELYPVALEWRLLMFIENEESVPDREAVSESTRLEKNEVSRVVQLS